MVDQETFSLTGTTITLYDDNERIALVFGRNSRDTKEVIDQAVWIGDMFEKFHQAHPKNKFRVLVDFDKMTKPQLPGVARDVYRDIIKRVYIKKVAFVADGMSYYRLVPLLIVTRFGRRKVRFFMRYPEATKWLKWK